MKWPWSSLMEPVASIRDASATAVAVSWRTEIIVIMRHIETGIKDHSKMDRERRPVLLHLGASRRL